LDYSKLFRDVFGTDKNISEMESISLSKPFIRGNYRGVAIKFKEFGKESYSKTVKLDSEQKERDILFLQKIVRKQKLEKQLLEIIEEINEYFPDYSYINTKSSNMERTINTLSSKDINQIVKELGGSGRAWRTFREKFPDKVILERNGKLNRYYLPKENLDIFKEFVLSKK
jgi:hypothetical protein